MFSASLHDFQDLELLLAVKAAMAVAAKASDNNFLCCQSRSCLVWAPHKSASTFISSLLSEIQRLRLYRHSDFSRLIWSAGELLSDIPDPYSLERQGVAYNKTGHIYGPLRTPFVFDGMKDFANLMFVRDPRDLLVSCYYSMAFSHGIPEGRSSEAIFLEQRASALSLGMESYVILQLREWIIPFFDQLRMIRESALSCQVFYYEDFIKNPEMFIENALLFLGIDASLYGDSIKSLAAKARAPFGGDEGADRKWSHHRSGRDGQFVSELGDDVRELLDLELKPILDYWGFNSECK